MSMTVKQLTEALNGYDPTMEVTVRFNVEPDAEDSFSDTEVNEVNGEYLNVADDRSILVEYGKLVIIGDLQP